VQAICVRLGAIEALREPIHARQAELDRAVAAGNWSGIADQLADAIGEVIRRIERQKVELVQFLEALTAQLEQFEVLTSSSREADQARLEDSDQLENSIEREMRGIDRAVADSDDVSELKQKIQARLETVASSIHSYRAREAERQAAAEMRNAELARQVDLLKEKTSSLSEQVQASESRLQHDTLTGLSSRYAYELRLNDEYGRWTQGAGELAFVIWDIDKFKRINDSYGHGAGDRLLQLVAKFLNDSLREQDFVARVGGEEFVMLLPNTDAAVALTLADAVRRRIAESPFHHKGTREQVTVSAGITTFGEGDTPAAVYERADQALYQAKNQGRNRCVTA
jgi:diguanylate cyclase